MGIINYYNLIFEISTDLILSIQVFSFVILSSKDFDFRVMKMKLIYSLGK